MQHVQVHTLLPDKPRRSAHFAGSEEETKDQVETGFLRSAVSRDEVVSSCHRTRPPLPGRLRTFTQVDGALLRLPSLGTVLRRHTTEPLVASPVQRG